MNDIIYVGKHALTLSVAKHIHESWEFIYCTGGSGRLLFTDRELTYAENTVVIIPPMMPHSNISTDGFTNIHVNMKDVTLNYKEPVILTMGRDGLMAEAFAAAFYIYSRNDAARSLVLPAYAQVIIALIQSASSNTEHSEIVQQIVDHILKNYTDPDYDLNAYIRSLPFSFEYLRKMFRAEMGITARQYLLDRRLENAASNLLIVGTSANVSQIAFQSGFHEPLYFSRLFKKKYGVSPKNYSESVSRRLEAASDDTKILL